MATFHIKQGDGSPIWETTLQDSAGTAINLAGATVTLDMTRVGLATKKIDGAAVTLQDAANGVVRYTFSTSDTDTVGLFRAQWNVSYSGGVPETFPNEGYDYVYVEKSL